MDKVEPKVRELAMKLRALSQNPRQYSNAALSTVLRELGTEVDRLIPEFRAQDQAIGARDQIISDLRSESWWCFTSGRIGRFFGRILRRWSDAIGG